MPKVPRRGRNPEQGMARAEVLRDLISDVLIELSVRRGRTLLVLAAVALSTGALIASVGVSQTAAQQIGADIAATTLDEISVSVRPGDPDSQGSPAEPEPVPVPTDEEGEPVEGYMDGTDRPAIGSAPLTTFPDDADARAMSINLVDAAGRQLTVTGLPGVDVTRTADVPTARSGLIIRGATPGYLDAARVDVPEGREWLLDGEDPVVFLGSVAAEHLGVPITNNPTGYHVWIDGQRYAVVGFLSSSAPVDGPASQGPAASDVAAPESASVVIPYQQALELTGSDSEASMLVRTAPGAGAAVGPVVRDAIRPDAPERLEASQVQSLNALRDGVSTQLGRLAAGIGAFLAVLTALLIASSMIASVVARTGEIGLRRALGASKRDVALVFLGEGAVVGVLGGIAGGALALVLVVGASAINGWSALTPAWMLVVGPLLGGAIGIASATYPAVRAGRISPAIAVRAD